MSELDYRDPEWVSEKLGLERNTVYKYLKEGSIPAVRIGKKWLISESKLIEWLRVTTDDQTSERRKAVTSISRTITRLDNYSLNAKKIIKGGHTLARACGHTYFGQEHLIVAMFEVSECSACKLLKKFGLNASKIKDLFNKRFPSEDREVPRRLPRSIEAKEAIKLAARADDQGIINTGNILKGIFKVGKGGGYEMLIKTGVKF